MARRRWTARRVVTSIVIACAFARASCVGAIRPETRKGSTSDVHASDDRQHHRTRAELTLETMARRGQYARAMRHPMNDLDPRTSACDGEVLRTKCSIVEEARAAVRIAKRRVEYEENLERRSKEARAPRRTEHVDDAREEETPSRGRNLLYDHTRPYRRQTPQRRKSPLSDSNLHEKQRKEADEKKRQDAEENEERQRLIEERAFAQLKSFPKGTLARDPNQLEEDIKAVKQKLAEEPNNEVLNERLAKLERDKKTMIQGASTMGLNMGGAAMGVSDKESAEDHWFMKGDQGDRTTYRKQHRERRFQSAKDAYEYLLKKIPVAARSYYDCVEQIASAEEKTAFMRFVEFGGRDGIGKEATFSRECIAEIKTAKRRIYEFWQAEKDVVAACDVELKQNCANVEHGSGLITSCLWKVKTNSSLSSSCVASLDAINLAPATAHATAADDVKEVVSKEDVAPKQRDIDAKTREPVGKPEEKGKEEESKEPEVVRENKFAKFHADKTPLEPGQEPEKGVQAKLREAEARLKLAEEAAAHAAAQSRNLFTFLIFAGFIYVVSRKGIRKNVTGIVRRLRREAKGDHLG